METTESFVRAIRLGRSPVSPFRFADLRRLTELALSPLGLPESCDARWRAFALGLQTVPVSLHVPGRAILLGHRVSYELSRDLRETGWSVDLGSAQFLLRGGPYAHDWPAIWFVAGHLALPDRRVLRVEPDIVRLESPFTPSNVVEARLAACHRIAVLTLHHAAQA